MAGGYGSVAYPVPSSLFGRIVEVGWGGKGVAIVQVTAPDTKLYDVLTITPPDIFSDPFSGSEITEDDYKEAFILQMSVRGVTGSVVTEDELNDVWVWDRGLEAAPGEAAEAEVATITAELGYAPNLHFSDQRVVRHFPDPPGSGLDYFAGDTKQHTHPNGSVVNYLNGYTLEADPDFDSWYWYRVTTRAGQTVAIFRASFLVNFRKDFVTTAELRDYVSSLDAPLDWIIKGYPAATGFTIADGIMTPIGGVAVKYSASGSEAGSHAGQIRQFNRQGFI